MPKKLIAVLLIKPPMQLVYIDDKNIPPVEGKYCTYSEKVELLPGRHSIVAYYEERQPVYGEFKFSNTVARAGPMPFSFWAIAGETYLLKHEKVRSKVGEQPFEVELNLKNLDTGELIYLQIPKGTFKK